MKRDNKEKGSLRFPPARVLSMLLILAMFVTMVGVPQEVQAKSKKKKATYSISVNNINSNTVLRKGSTLKIQASATVTKKGVKKSTPVKFRSSKKKVATVSSKGKIKAKKKGTTYITVYCKKKPSKKKKIKIRVGTPVSSISVSGSRYLNKGRSSTLKASVNKGATNKSVTWRSDNPAVATVNKSGKVTAKGYGSCNVYATAKDGSGVRGARTIIVHHYTRDEVVWIAHRGFHTKHTENTANAFRAAGDNGFPACECDAIATRHSTYNVVLPPMPTTTLSSAEIPEDTIPSALSPNVSAASDPNVDPAIDAIRALSLNGLDTDAVLDKAAEIKGAFDLYNGLNDA